jgi:hypothetical protein
LEASFIHGENCIAATTGFKSASFLKVFCFKKQLAANDFVQRLTLEYGGPVDVWRYARMGLLNVFYGCFHTPV